MRGHVITLCLKTSNISNSYPILINKTGPVNASFVNMDIIHFISKESIHLLDVGTKWMDGTGFSIEAELSLYRVIQ